MVRSSTDKPLLIGLASAFIGANACTVSYEPARSPRVAVVQDTGGLAYVRDGVHYSHGLTGNGLQDAVRGSPRAEHEAVLYSRKLGWGFGMGMAGLGVMIGGLAALPTGNQHFEWNTRAYTGLSLIGLGLAAYTTGLILVLSAGPHQWDAINIYNDEVDARLRMQFIGQRPYDAGYQILPVAPPAAAMPSNQPWMVPQPGVATPPPNAPPPQ